MATRRRGRTRPSQHRSCLRAGAGASRVASAGAGDVAPPVRPGSRARRPSRTRRSRGATSSPSAWQRWHERRRTTCSSATLGSDRQADAKDVYDLFVGKDISVWFSEVTLRPGTDIRVAIDKGLVSSRMGIVLVTPAMLGKLRTDRSIASNELSALLRRNLLVPVMHGVTFEELDQVSPTLASRGGFSTAEEPMEDIVVKITELVGTLAEEEATNSA